MMCDNIYGNKFIGKLLSFPDVPFTILVTFILQTICLREPLSSYFLFGTLFTFQNPNIWLPVLPIWRHILFGQKYYLRWCHRIFPIQATCSLDEKEVHTAVSKLVNQFLKDERNKVARPLKFAVGYNRRGIEETEMKDARVTSNGSHVSALFDRNKCFSIVAAAVKDAVPDSAVNLKCPELAVLVEVLPLSGIPTGRVVVGISVLPQMLVSSKPRLSVKALVTDGKASTEKSG